MVLSFSRYLSLSWSFSKTFALWKASQKSANDNKHKIMRILVVCEKSCVAKHVPESPRGGKHARVLDEPVNMHTSLHTTRVFIPPQCSIAVTYNHGRHSAELWTLSQVSLLFEIKLSQQESKIWVRCIKNQKSTSASRVDSWKQATTGLRWGTFGVKEIQR
jgi:hypothetical protein